MGRPGGGPHDAVGDVVGRKRLVAAINPRRPFGVAGKTHQREVGFDQARVDLGHPDGFPQQLEAQGARKRPHRVFGPGITAAASVGFKTGDRADVDDVGVPMGGARGAQGRQQRAHHADDGHRVHFVHLEPTFERRVFDTVEAERAASVVDQQVDFGDAGIAHELVDAGGITNVERQGHGRGQAADGVAQAVESTRPGDHVVPSGGQAAYGGGTDAGAAAGDDRRFLSRLVHQKLSPRGG